MHRMCIRYRERAHQPSQSCTSYGPRVWILQKHLDGDSA